MVGYSDDLPGLLVQARSLADLRDRVPGAIREILEAGGSEVHEIQQMEEAEDEGDAPEAFQPRNILANVRMMAEA